MIAMKFSAPLISKIFLGRNAEQNKRNAPRSRNLKLETLENRELLSVGRGIEFSAPNASHVAGFIGGGFTVEEATAAYETSVSPRVGDVGDVIDLAETLLDDDVTTSEFALVDAFPDVSIDLEGAVPGPGRPSVFYDADKSAFNTKDDEMCWAASASNILWSTGWASVSGLANEQEFFDSIFVGTWPNSGGNAETGASWYLDGKYLTLYKWTNSTSTWTAIGENSSHQSIPGGGAYAELFSQYNESANDYVSGTSVLGVSDLAKVASNLQSGAGVGLKLDKDGRSGHAVTCWGYTVDDSLEPTDPGYFTGLYITDSDDEKSGKNDDYLNDRKLLYREILWDPNVETFYGTGSYRIGTNTDSSPSGPKAFYINAAVFLAPRPEKYAVLDPATVIETPSTVVTTASDVVDAYDGIISLREAIRYANAGDAITFESSLKGKTIVLNSSLGQLQINKSLTIDASNLYDTTTDAPGVTISGNNAIRILWLAGNTSLTLKGLKFTKGKSPACGGAIWNNGDLTVENCLFADNNATYVNNSGGTGNYYGGAIAVKPGATLVANGTTFTGNAGGGTVSFQTERASFLTDCVFRGNIAQGVYATTNYEGVAGEVSLAGCVFEENKNDGVYLYDNDGGVVSLTNCVVEGNEGFGVYAYKGSLTATNCTIEKNQNYGVFLYEGSVTATNSVFQENLCGIYLAYGGVTATDCVFQRNNGKGVYAGSGEFSATNVVIRDNKSQGIYCAGKGTINATNCLVTGNTESWGAGMALVGVANLYNCTIAGNVATSSAGGVGLNSGGVLNAYNTIIAGNTNKIVGDMYAYSADCTVNGYNTLSPFTAWTSGANNLTYDASKPLFTDASGGDYTLAQDSQAIDKGDNSFVKTSVDLANRTRTNDGTVDLGAYEYQTAPEPIQLAAPTNPRTTAQTATTATLSWDAVEHAAGYELDYKKTTDSDYATISVNADTTSYELAGLDSTATYYWRARAIGDGTRYLTSDYTATQTVGRDPEPIRLATPNPTYAPGQKSIAVSWDAVPNASSYRITYKPSGGSVASVNVAAARTSYTIANLVSGTTYALQMAALGDGANYLTSEYSALTSVQVPQNQDESIVVTTANDVVDANDGVISLREAIRNATAGDAITFESSLKGKTIVLNSALGQLQINKSLTIDASNLYDTTTDAPGVTISGNNAIRILWLAGNTSLTLKGLKFTKGKSPACGGAIWNNGDLTVENCLFADNNATYVDNSGGVGDYYGGAIAVKPGATLVANGTTFTGNAGGGAVSFQTERASSFINCVFRANISQGVYATTNYEGVAGEVSLTDCVFEENKNDGVYIYGNEGGVVSLTNCVVEGNEGAGVYSYEGAVTAANCTVQKNTNYGFFVYKGSLTTTNSVFQENDLSGIYLAYGGVTATDCVFQRNDGKGVFAGSGEFSATNVVIRDNKSQGIYCAGNGTINATNCLVTGNSESWGAGLALVGVANLYNCTITGNVASNSAGGVGLNGGAVLNAYNTIIAGNAAQVGGDMYAYSVDCTANGYNTLSSFTAWTSGANNLTYDASKPLFTDASGGDYTLAQDSQAIDKGDNSFVKATVDLANNARVVNGTVDLGAYERADSGTDLSTGVGGNASLSQLVVGGALTISGIEATNRSELPSNSFVVRLYASTDTTIDETDVEIGEIVSSGLEPGETRAYSTSKLATNLLAPGKSYFFGWRLDCEADPDASNNVGRLGSSVYFYAENDATIVSAPFEQSGYSTQEGCDFYLAPAESTTAAFGSGYEYWLDLGQGAYVKRAASGWFSTAAEGLTRGSYDVELKIVDPTTRQVVGKGAAALAVDATEPRMEVVASPLGAFGLRLALAASSGLGAPARGWRVDWGDGSTSFYDALSYDLTVAHLYAPQSASKTYDVTVTLYDSESDEIGASYDVGAFTAASASNALLDVALANDEELFMEDEWFEDFDDEFNLLAESLLDV